MNTKDTNTVVGKPLNRVDGYLKVTGGARYAAEFPVAKMTYGVTIQSAIAKGKIAQINTKAAEQVPGVLAVITHLNAPKASWRKGGGHKVQVLQDNIVLYSGQHIGVVVADTFERAMYAASLVQVRYDEENQPLICGRISLRHTCLKVKSLERNRPI